MAGEIAGYPTKATPVAGDKLIGTDSADGTTKTFDVAALRGLTGPVGPAGPSGGGAGGGLASLDPTTTAGDLLYRRPHGVTTVPIGFIGDSITFGYGTTTPAPTLVAGQLTGHGLTVTALNQGRSGSRVFDWFPGAGTGYWETALAAFQAAGVQLVHLMFGPNDMAYSSDPAVMIANYRLLLGYLVGAGFLPVLSDSINGTYGPLITVAAESVYLRNGITVLKGDTSAAAYFTANPGSWDGTHPNDTGTPVMAGYWAAALRPYVLALSGPLALDRVGIGAPLTYLQVNAAGTGYQFGTPAGGGGAGAQTRIAQVVLASAAATLAFSAIAGTYEDLIVEVMGRGDTAANSVDVSLRFNGDTGANYDTQRFASYGGANSLNDAQNAATSMRVTTIAAGTAPTGTAGSATIVIPSYARTVFHKTVQAQGAGRYDVAGTQSMVIMGNWRATAAITGITLLPAAGNFIAGTVATLWGRS